MITVKQVEAARERVNEAREARAQAEGALNQILASMKVRHGCTDRKQAERKLAALDREIATLETSITKAYEDFTAKYPELL